MRPRLAPLPVLLLTVGLAGCSMTPAYEVPRMALPDRWGGTAAEAAGQTEGTVTPTSAWWRVFGESELDVLEEAAADGNRDLKAAIARIEQAEAKAVIAGAPLLPTVEAGGNGQVAKKASASKVSRSYQASLSASYEIDFWGKTRATIESAEAAVEASRFDHDTVALTLAADVATTWFQTLALADRVEAARRNLEIARQTLDLTEKQAAFGQASELEAAQQRTTVAQIEAQLPALELQRQQAVDALAVLTGVAPSQFAVRVGTLQGIRVPAVAAGLPADLLARRPDIRQAEANLRAANADIGTARAELFPSITLTAEGGRSSATLENLLSPSNAFWTLAGGVAATLFDNGKLRANVSLSEARKRELAETYQASVLSALKDVEDALASVHWLAAQEAAQQVAVEAARSAQRLADIRYREGATDYLTVLNAQRTLLSAEDGAVQVRQARLDAVVGLFKALGGGMEE